jgi:hypothetical protein
MAESWVTVPTNSTITIHKQTVMIHPIVDKYYSYNPYHSRSSKFVRDKGLITNEKNGPLGVTPIVILGGSGTAPPSGINGTGNTTSSNIGSNVNQSLSTRGHARIISLGSPVILGAKPYSGINSTSPSSKISRSTAGEDRNDKENQISSNLGPSPSPSPKTTA